MNIKAIYAAGAGIAVAAVAIFFVLGPGLSGGPGFPPAQNNATNTRPSVVPPVLAIKNVTAVEGPEDSAQVTVTFAVENPNTTTVLLENIHYNISVDGKRMTIGDVGESPEGFLASQGSIFTIVAKSTLTVGDTQTAERNSAIAEEWDRMVAGDATYTVDGTYFYRSTASNLDTSIGEEDFSLTFP